jgi:hypothetical protein
VNLLCFGRLNFSYTDEGLFEVLISHSLSYGLCVLPELGVKECFHSSGVSLVILIVIVSVNELSKFVVFNFTVQSVNHTINCCTSE